MEEFQVVKMEGVVMIRNTRYEAITVIQMRDEEGLEQGGVVKG